MMMMMMIDDDHDAQERGLETHVPTWFFRS